MEKEEEEEGGTENATQNPALERSSLSGNLGDLLS